MMSSSRSNETRSLAKTHISRVFVKCTSVTVGSARLLPVQSGQLRCGSEVWFTATAATAFWFQRYAATSAELTAWKILIQLSVRQPRDQDQDSFGQTPDNDASVNLQDWIEFNHDSLVETDSGGNAGQTTTFTLQSRSGPSSDASGLISQRPTVVAGSQPSFGGPFSGNSGPSALSPVPEPSTWMMFGTGVAILVGPKRRRRPSTVVAEVKVRHLRKQTYQIMKLPADVPMLWFTCDGRFLLGVVSQNAVYTKADDESKRARHQRLARIVSHDPLKCPLYRM